MNLARGVIWKGEGGSGPQGPLDEPMLSVDSREGDSGSADVEKET